MRHTIVSFVAAPPVVASFCAALAGVGTWGATAHAQGNAAAPAYYNAPPVTTNPAKEERFMYQQVPAPVNAFELKVNAGYTQGFGKAAPNAGMPNVAGGGVNGTIDLDYRMNPWVSFGIQGEYQEFTSRENSNARGFVGNLGVTGHLSPLFRGDPYARIGVGYRQLWSVNPTNAPTTAYMGIELAKLSLGYDIRLSPGVAIAPQIGADVNLFIWQNQASSTTTLDSVTVATFIYAGLQGRFDMGGTTTDSTTVASR
jgi:hypothetical protein